MKHFCIKIGQEFMNLSDVCQLLQQTYWAQNESIQTIQKSMEHSICFGIFDELTNMQVAFARVITDYATRFYIVDVVVDTNYRSKGLGNELIHAIIHYEPLQNLRGLLMTKDASGLYSKLGFKEYNITCMQRTFP